MLIICDIFFLKIFIPLIQWKISGVWSLLAHHTHCSFWHPPCPLLTLLEFPKTFFWNYDSAMNNLSANILRPRYRTCWIKLLGNCVTNEQGKPFELCMEIIVSWTNHFSVHPNNNVSILCTYCAPITHDIYLSIIDKQCVQIVDMITFRLHWLGHHLHQDWSP